MGTPPNTNNKGAQPSKPSPFDPAPGNKVSLLLEKNRNGMRRSTPDSEALASSDDEIEQKFQNQNQAATAPKPVRRTSWLNDVPTALSRKASVPANSSANPGNSNPASPTAEQSTWGPTSPSLVTSLSWGTGGGSFPWGTTGIWGADARKEPPARLSEVLQSPTSTHPPYSGVHENDILSPVSRISVSGESSIPFAIPLHPTPKTYRSQSYSVGQIDPESATPTQNNPALAPGRARNSAQYPIQRRASRPSVLGELGHDPASLGRVREDEDDGNANEADNTFNNWSTTQAHTIEQLARENALLRQVATTSQLDNPRFRDRALSSASAHGGYSVAQAHNLHPIQGSVPEESALAVEDLDELGDLGYNPRFNTRRRYSEHSANLEKQFPTFTSLENRTLENMKRAQWQSSLGFSGGAAGLPQSRRHSFADVPTRHTPSFTPGDSHAPVGTAIPAKAQNGPGSHADLPLSPSTAEHCEYYHFPEDFAQRAIELEHLRVRQHAAGYFSGRDIPLRTNEPAPASGISTALHQAYVMPNAYGRQHAMPQPNQQLFIVTFKCCRADVFYIQEDTGLQVKPGDLVIVEADRGTDLGTVAQANVSWAKAREYKEHYAEEHYKWLMLFSRQSQTGAANAVNPNGLSSLSGAPGSAVGGMGPQSHNTVQDQAGEIKPKLVKRLAQNHEIQTLRDKEGNEAKAKRVCQQKVVEHRLNMEILDAEFQMYVINIASLVIPLGFTDWFALFRDWKKLTFYYFADTYINFNALVTDLFKIYKTRIWMSAINPASFATPTAGLNPQGMYGQSPLGDHRRAHDYKPFGPSMNQGVSPGAFAEQPNRDGMLGQGNSMRGSYIDPYQSFNIGGRPDPGYAQTPQTDPFSSYTPSSSSYGFLDPSAPEYGPSGGVGPGGVNRIGPAQNDWVNNFQGLSLGS